MSCILRASAPDIATAAGKGALKPFRLEDGTAHFEVSAAGFDQLSVQIDDAISFLRRFKNEVEELMSLPGSAGFLDFAVANRHRAAQFGRLSPELVCMAGKAGLGLELSLYSVAEDQGAEA